MASSSSTGPSDESAIDVDRAAPGMPRLKAGVEVTGTVRVPRVRLVSNSTRAGRRKLSWLMTGQGLDRASRADVAALAPHRRCSSAGGQRR